MQFTMLKETELAGHSDEGHLTLARDGRVSPDNAKIKRLRGQLGYSQEYVAGMTGINVRTIRNLESKTNGRCKLATLKSLALFFDVEVRVLINPEGKPKIPVTHVLKAHPRCNYLMKRPLEIEQDVLYCGMIKPEDRFVQE
jgi:transcriptional regulator with XRE-family HTH domain